MSVSIESYYDLQYKKKKRIIAFFCIILGIALGLIAGFFFFGRSDISTKNLKNNLSQIVKLPDEKPSIAEIVNVEELKERNPLFYINAKEGDLLIVYSNKAIIFRESENKIINVYNLDNINNENE